MKKELVNSELYHFGVKGMKWGVRRASKKSRLTRDIERYNKATSKYYEAVNRYNTTKDLGDANESFLNKEIKHLKKSEAYARHLTKKLEKRYPTVSAIPEFDKNGYIVKNVKTTIVELDKKGRLNSVNTSYTPVQTYDYEFGGSKHRSSYIREQSKRKKSMSKDIEKMRKKNTNDDDMFDFMDKYDL